VPPWALVLAVTPRPPFMPLAASEDIVPVAVHIVPTTILPLTSRCLSIDEGPAPGSLVGILGPSFSAGEGSFIVHPLVVVRHQRGNSKGADTSVAASLHLQVLL
jgi:hypothetical protein